MKQWFSILTVVAVVAAAAAPAAAQQPSDEWNVVVAPYLMGAAMSGAITVRGATAEVELSASDIFSNLEFGAMGILTARKGQWGFAGDAIWMALGATVREIDVDSNQGAFAFYGLRRLNATADVTFGVRVNTLQAGLTFKGPDVTREQDKTWVDPIAGLTLRTAADHRVQLRVYTEVGGFGVGSDFSWQVFPTASIKLTDAAALELGYRWLNIDYASGEGSEEFRYDMLTQGPIVGFSFRF